MKQSATSNGLILIHNHHRVLQVQSFLELCSIPIVYQTQPRCKLVQPSLEPRQLLCSCVPALPIWHWCCWNPLGVHGKAFTSLPLTSLDLSLGHLPLSSRQWRDCACSLRCPWQKVHHGLCQQHLLSKNLHHNWILRWHHRNSWTSHWTTWCVQKTWRHSKSNSSCWCAWCPWRAWRLACRMACLESTRWQKTSTWSSSHTMKSKPWVSCSCRGSGCTGTWTVGGPCGPDILYTGVVPVSKCPETSPAGALLALPVSTAVPGSVLGLIGPGPLISSCQIFHRSFTDLFCNSHSKTTAVLKVFLSVCPSPSGSLGLRYHVKTRERRGSSFSQLGLEPNHTGLTAQSLFFLEESCRVKRSESHTDSSKTMKTSPADNDSPEEPHASASPIAVEDADLPTLKSMKRETKNELAELATKMCHLQGRLECLNKRIKTVQSDKGNVSTSSSPTPDIEMEVVDWPPALLPLWKPARSSLLWTAAQHRYKSDMRAANLNKEVIARKS